MKSRKRVIPSDASICCDCEGCEGPIWLLDPEAELPWYSQISLPRSVNSGCRGSLGFSPYDFLVEKRSKSFSHTTRT